MKHLAYALLFLTLGACSDNGATTDSALPDGATHDASAVDAPTVDAPTTDAPTTDAPTADAPNQSDLAVADSGSPDQVTSDGGYSGCEKIINHCSASLIWGQYITPFNVATCNQVMKCVTTFYSGTCAATAQQLITCTDTITTSATCDTQCMTQITYLNQNCACPAACGVPCP